MIVLTHYALNNFIGILEHFLVNLIFIGKQLIVVLVLFGPLSDDLSDDISDLVRTQNESLHFFSCPDLYRLSARVEWDEILSMFI